MKYQREIAICSHHQGVALAIDSLDQPVLDKEEIHEVGHYALLAQTSPLEEF
jgi:hypothetical protein